MISIAKNSIQKKIFDYLSYIERTGEELIITENKQPAFKILPINARFKPEDVFGDLKGKVKYYEDINSSTESEWAF